MIIITLSILLSIGFICSLLKNIYISTNNIFPIWVDSIGNLSLPILLFILIEYYHVFENRFLLLRKLLFYGIITGALNMIFCLIQFFLKQNEDVLVFATNPFLIGFLSLLFIEILNMLKLKNKLTKALNLLMFLLLDIILVSNFQYDILTIVIIFIFYKHRQNKLIRNTLLILSIFIVSVVINKLPYISMLLSLIFIIEYKCNSNKNSFNKFYIFIKFYFITYTIMISIINILKLFY